MKKIVTSILLLTVISFTSHAFAAMPDLSKLGQMTMVADVNIVDSSIVSQSNNTFTVSFGIKNGTGTQTGLKYGIRLQKEDKAAQYIVDEKVYDEVLTLQPDTNIKRQVTYTAPAQLDGQYHLYVTSQNANGFPFGADEVGTVTLKQTETGVSIDPASCTVSGKAILQPVSIKPGSALSVQCTLVNTSTRSVAVQPAFETHLGSVYGDVVQTPVNTESQTLVASEKKDVTFSVPVPVKPQQYVALMHLTSNGASVSNTVTIPYVISGASATIQNVSFDKTQYQSGSQAALTIAYTAVGTDATATITSALVNKQGKSCGAPVTQQLATAIGPALIIQIPVSQSCMQPQAQVTITNGDGTVLDQKSFSITATPINNPKISLVIVALAIILVAGLLLKKKHPVAVVTVLFLGIALMPTQTHASSYVYTPPGWQGSATLTINIDKATYTVGEPINITASIVSNSPDVFPVYLTVSTAGGGSTTLIPAATLVAYGNTGTQSRTISAPSTPGSGTVDFENHYENRFIMGSTSSFSTSAQACTLGDPNSHSYYQPVSTRPDSPSDGTYLYLSQYDYVNNTPYSAHAGWLAMQYSYSPLTDSGTSFTNYSSTYSVQIDSSGKIIASNKC